MVKQRIVVEMAYNCVFYFRTLQVLSDEVLKELSIYYRKMVSYASFNGKSLHLKTNMKTPHILTLYMLILGVLCSIQPRNKFNVYSLFLMFFVH